MRFSEESDLKSVITTRYVVDANSLITYVVYDEDGGWQFLGNEDVIESDACVVSVQQMLSYDDTLYNLPDLKLGQAAERNDIDAEWTTVKPRKDDYSFSGEEREE